ncbi:Oidioi.mRNA.OKI2018_I69.chr2.g4729.t1.cds [Oikopleura dioica]|uniref:Oidioi.mRNA.OKI2018_I69.chr2.g4729.t1.cds n=1 Tax=Oikopleura dioica TaxID=34765 RepID=A0ABN7T3Q8_OIKDI|nr:Oidioi.mRNA.OKI2018_I69.chr2.g4729.t1.cds [Oikopleura dioica]
MKVSPFVAIFANSSNADFFKFWGDADVFAYQVRESFPRPGLGRRFLKKYDEVQQIVRYFQLAGVCESSITSPTHEPAQNFDAVFDSRASPSTNIEALANLLERWIESYACVDDSGADDYEAVQQSLLEMRKIAKKPANQDQDVSYHISEEKMTYNQALAYCFAHDMWLADPQNWEEQSEVIENMTISNYVWFDSWKARENECWVQKYFSASGPGGVVKEGLWAGAVDCNDKNYAICQSGQIRVTATTTTTTTTTKTSTTTTTEPPPKICVEFRNIAIFASSTSAGFFEFWGEANLFAYQVRESLPRPGLGRRFLEKYDEVKQVVRFFQFEGNCESTITSPTHEPAQSFAAIFDSRASPSTNIEALVNRLEWWIESYACVDDSSADDYEAVQQSLLEMKKIAKKPVNQDQDVSYHISDEKMSYNQARAYCFANDMWLADPQNWEEQSEIIDNMTINNYVWFDSWKARENECWVQQYFTASGPGGFVKEGLWAGAVDCDNKNYAICQSGQIRVTATTTTTTTTTATSTTTTEPPPKTCKGIMKAIFAGLILFAVETAAKREFTAFQLAVRQERRETAKTMICDGVPVFDENIDNGLLWHCKKMPRVKHMERGWCRPRCAARKTSRTGPKRIRCDKELGWVNKADNSIISPSDIFCS